MRSKTTEQLRYELLCDAACLLYDVRGDSYSWPQDEGVLRVSLAAPRCGYHKGALLDGGIGRLQSPAAGGVWLLDSPPQMAVQRQTFLESHSLLVTLSKGAQSRVIIIPDAR